MNKLLKILSRKKKEKLGYVIWIDFTPSAKQFIVGGPKNKRMYHYKDGKLINIETYNIVKERYYQRNNIIVIDKTEGSNIPKDAVHMKPEKQALGVIELRRRIQ
ncbi:MAG: hypothetical protein ACP5D2_02760 [Candidatus Nanoarchaeia archaeon]